MTETVEKNLPILVERAAATELKHLATREDLQLVRVEMQGIRTELKDDINKMGEKVGNKLQTWFLWLFGLLIVVLGSFIATLFAVLQTKIPIPQ